MSAKPDRMLLAAGSLSGLAALLHLGCIAFGAPWYRALGAGEGMARAAAAGHPRPTIMALVIASILALWALYAFSAAGAMRRLPLTRTALSLITAVYLVRGVAAPAMTTLFPDRSLNFWIWSSAICLTIGVVHLIGLIQVWNRLGTSRAV
ncbi:MAG: hypothetical protein ACREP7_04210 [Lysobacter sp.]